MIYVDLNLEKCKKLLSNTKLSDSNFIEIDMGNRARHNKRADDLADTIKQIPGYKLAAKRLAKTRIEILTEQHAIKHDNIIEYVSTMQAYDRIFSEIRTKDCVNDIEDILETIERYEKRYRERFVDLSFIDTQNIRISGEIAKCKEVIFDSLADVSLKNEKITPVMQLDEDMVNRRLIE